MAKAAASNTDYESMDYAGLSELSASLDAERTALNERIAEVNEVRGRKEVAEDLARRAAEASVDSEVAEAQTVENQGVESAEGVGSQ